MLYLPIASKTTTDAECRVTAPRLSRKFTNTFSDKPSTTRTRSAQHIPKQLKGSAPLSFSTLFCESFLGCLVPCPGGPIGCMRLLTSPMSSAFPLGGWVGFPLLVHDATFRGNDFRGCRHSVMFRPPSLFASQVAPTATAMP